jgi:hypothetical protein
MKELEQKRKDEIKIVSERQIEKQLKFMGNIFVRPNQKCYEYNMLTKELQIAKTECIINPFATGKKIDIYNGGTIGESKFEQKVITKDDCLYVVAINERNAKRKLGL